MEKTNAQKPPPSKKAQLSLENLWALVLLLILVTVLSAALLPSISKARSAAQEAQSQQQAAQQSLTLRVVYMDGNSIHLDSNELNSSNQSNPTPSNSAANDSDSNLISRLSYAPS